MKVIRARENRQMMDRLAHEAEVIRRERAEEEEMKRSMESRVYFDSVVQLARDLREKEELEEEMRKRKKSGQGAFPT
jgi:hypothetical protein